MCIDMLNNLFPGSQHADSDTQENSKPSPSNPFNRAGGTILLPEPPVHFQANSSTSSLGLQLSQGYSQMYGGNSAESSSKELTCCML